MQLVDCLEDCFMTQHVVAPTRGKNILDLVITNEPDMVDHVDIYGGVTGSDHSLLSWTVNVNVEKDMKNQLVFNYKQADYQKIHKELIDINWVEQLSGTAEESWNYLKSKMHELINKYIPRRKRLVKKNKPIWMTSKAFKLVRKKYRLHKKYGDPNYPAYKRIARETKRN
jgi:hypothetical protein